MFTEEQKKEIIRKLEEKGIKAICPMCHTNNFIISDGYFRNDLQDDIKHVNLGGIAIPSVAIICAKCGFISQHALGPLGLLSIESQEVKK